MNKNEVLCTYLQNLFANYKVKAEYSTNSDDLKVITVQEQSGEKIVLFGNCDPLFNYYEIVIYGETIAEQKAISTQIGNLIGQNETITIGNDIYQIMFKQMQNPQAIEYMNIRRIGYQTILKTIISKIYEGGSF